jgi:hypothetical protein
MPTEGSEPSPKYAGPERLDALKFLSQTHRELHGERRKIEYQVMISTCSFYALAAAAALSAKATIPHKWFVWVFFGGLAFLSSVHLAQIHRANQLNKEVARNAENEIMDDLLVNGWVPKSPPHIVRGLVVWWRRRVKLAQFVLVRMYIVLKRTKGKLISMKVLRKPKKQKGRDAITVVHHGWIWFWESGIVLAFGLASAWIVTSAVPGRDLSTGSVFSNAVSTVSVSISNLSISPNFTNLVISTGPATNMPRASPTNAPVH